MCGGLARPDTVAVTHGLFGVSGTGDTSGFGGLVRPITTPAAAERPYGGWFDEAVDDLRAGLAARGADPDRVLEKVVIDRGELTLSVYRRGLLVAAAALRDEPSLRFELCLGVSGIHYPEMTGRELHAVYPLRSITHNRLLRLATTAPDSDPRIPSLMSVYPTDDWHEREAYDFFGIVFTGHPSLTRIEMPDDWEGHPQRKDYPLGGIPVEYKGATVPPPNQRRSYR
ncbi:MAG: NADH-quinone oxidoreductase subunit C [Gordonia sp. (in: high G+C Gram-positive bacteria)]|uniref:NADH-quinone oxidoreductase subunit C n=1 Tax=Gordonia sp. (in: high G+C Gram-positive bacteria) TaxID=84139 RepID=UPI0039E5A9D3